jgi:hypothetical protein
MLGEDRVTFGLNYNPNGGYDVLKGYGCRKCETVECYTVNVTGWTPDPGNGTIKGTNALVDPWEES